MKYLNAPAPKVKRSFLVWVYNNLHNCHLWHYEDMVNANIKVFQIYEGAGFLKVKININGIRDYNFTIYQYNNKTNEVTLIDYALYVDLEDYINNKRSVDVFQRSSIISGHYKI